MNNELVLIESKSMRENYIDKDYILDKVKGLVLLPDNTYVTTEMVANYYDVKIEAIRALVKRHRNQIINEGLIIVKGMELNKYKNDNNLSTRVRALALYTKNAIIKIGVLLRNSLIAEKLREDILNNKNEKYLYMFGDKAFSLIKQSELKKILKTIYNYIDIQENFYIKGYYADFILNNSIIIECDEFDHKDRNKFYEHKRQTDLEQLGYKVLRYNPDSTDSYEIFKLINKINRLI